MEILRAASTCAVSKKHAVSWQNCVGVGNNKLLLSSIRYSFPACAALKNRWMRYNQEFLLGPAGPVRLRLQRRRERIEP